MPGNGFHIIIDGIDGSGKSTILNAVRDVFATDGKRVLDVPAIWRERGDYPTADEIAEADVICTAEPSTIWVGKAIRAEIIRTGSVYSNRTTAQAFALDRELHYRKIVIPARAAGKIIIQDRGVSSSIAYQAVRDGVSLEEVLAIPGNALALTHSPDVLVLATLSVDTALARLAARAGKNDDSRYERQADLENLAERYAAPWFQDLFTTRGTRIAELSTASDIATVRAASVALVQSFLE
ncbi:MAG: hypothetical protein AAB974_02405 [Patescibacteria group bacterium]